jgi:hypothetical protein
MQTVIQTLVDPLIFWGVFLSVLTFSFLPGYAISIYIKKINEIERLAVSFSLSFSLAVGLSLLLALYPPIVLQVLFLFILLVSIILVFHHFVVQRRAFTPILIIFLGIFLIQLTVKVVSQIGWEYPIQGGDWFAHTFEVPLRFANGDWTPHQGRPPFFNLLILFYHSILGTTLYDLWVSQIIITIANSVFLMPAFLIARKFFRNKVAIASVIFMSVNTFLFYQSIYPWPKNLSAYFCLMMIYFLLINERNLTFFWALAGFFAALGYLAHPMALFYIVPCIIVLAFQRGLFKPDLYVYVICLVVFVLPYFFWMYVHHGIITSFESYYPFVVEYDYKELYQMTHNEIMKRFWEAPLWKIIYIRIYNFVSTITELFAKHPVWYFMDNLPSVLTFPVFILSFIGVTMNYRKKASGVILLNIISLSFIFIVLFFGWRLPGIIGTGGQHPSVMILIIIAFYALFEIKDSLIRRIGVVGIFSYALLQLVARPYYIIKWFNEGERHGVINTIGRTWHYVEGFDFSKFISAHYFVNTKFEILFSLFVVVLFMSINIIMIFWSDRNVFSKIYKL